MLNKSILTCFVVLFVGVISGYVVWVCWAILPYVAYGLLSAGIITLFIAIARFTLPLVEKTVYIEIEREKEKVKIERERHEMHLQFALHSYAERTGAHIEIGGVKVTQALPQQVRVMEEAQQPLSLPSGEQQKGKPPILLDGLVQPTMGYLMSHLQEDRMQVAPGIRGTNGQPLVLTIPDAVHFKLIGSSGFGKSCLAGAMLQQAVSTNRPERLMIALLDLEHKTSRLFENSPNVACLQVGRRLVDMVATNADEVALHLGYLKKELDRRATLSEQELQREPLLLIYVEEMLSLQYEVDEKLLDQMFRDLSVLAVRARKYGMFLLACAQTDYSTPELKTAQKQFRSRMAFAIDITAARAAGFMNTELIKFSFNNSRPGDGLFVLETPGISTLMLAPDYDVKQELLMLDWRSQTRSASVQGGFCPRSSGVLNSTVEAGEPSAALGSQRSERSEHSAEVADLLSKNWTKAQIIEKVWGIKKGGSQRYKDAEMEYQQIISQLTEEGL